MNRPVLTQSCSRKNWSMVNPCLANTFYSWPVPWPAAMAAGLVRHQHCLLLCSPNWAAQSHTVLTRFTRIRCCGRACGACCNGTGMARNRASQIESINMQVYVKICTNMQTNALNMQTYARDMHINSENMQPYAGDMQIYASDMQRICKIYAQNMHRICTWYANICRKYATNMQRICTKYAEYMHKICTKYAPDMHLICRYMQYICTKYASNMQ